MKPAQEQQKKILIVEDEKIIAIDIKMTLEKLGYKVASIVSSGEHAVRKTITEFPDLILMDIMLGGRINGIEAATIITNEYNIPVVFLTALTDDETLQQAKIAGPYGYILKPFDERGLHTAIEMAFYMHKTETDIKRKNLEIEEETIKTDRLLNNILSEDIVRELKKNGIINPREYELVSILFTYFQAFSETTKELPANIIIKELNEIYNVFDTIVEKYKLEKLKTVGYSYMAGSGFPNFVPDHAVRIIDAADEMHAFLAERNKNSAIKWQMRAGVNSGKVIAGIVGSNKYTFDVWGDTVNIANRMESSSEPGRINISSNTYELVKNYFSVKTRGKLNVKGMGELDMYFIKGRL